MFEAKLVEAAKMEELVLELTLAFPEAIWEPIEVEAFKTAELVFVLTEAVPTVMADARELEAVVTSDCRARAPEVSVASVKSLTPYVQTSAAVMPRPTPLVSVLVPLFHTSAARVPKVVRDLAVLAQTAVGMVARSDVEAVRTVASV